LNAHFHFHVCVIDGVFSEDPEGDVIRAERVDLIALTTDGHTGLKRALLGSVSESVLKESHKPVLLERSMG
jgi:nucleotide-binding universal stress UspA family protein